MDFERTVAMPRAEESKEAKASLLKHAMVALRQGEREANETCKNVENRGAEPLKNQFN